MAESTSLVHPKERFYYIIMVIITVLFWLAAISIVFFSGSFKDKEILFIIAGYVFLIWLLIFIRKGIIIGYLRGNAVEVTEKQFPNILKAVEEQARRLNVKQIPTIYILQSGGLLNALATRFLGGSYIILYSEIAEAGLSRSNKALSFILGHELAHIKRRHILKRTLVLPSLIIPFLGLAYSRACELTCDRIGVSVSSHEGAQHGLLMLAGGKMLFNHIDIKEYVINSRKNAGFWQWLAEKLSTHPHIAKRLSKLFEI